MSIKLLVILFTIKLYAQNNIFRFELFPTGMPCRSDLSFRSHIGRNVADHAGKSSRLRNCYIVTGNGTSQRLREVSLVPK